MSAHTTPTTSTVALTQQSPAEKLFVMLLGVLPRFIGWLMFWSSVLTLALLALPVMRNPKAILVMVFAVIVLALSSALWGEGKFGRELAIRGAKIALVLSVISFFIPTTYINSFPSRDQVGQKLVNRGIIGGAWDGLKVAAFGKSATPTPTPTAEIAAHPSTLQKVLVLKFDGFTPVSFNINWEFELDTQGDPILLRFPGVPEPIKYSGKGTLPSPSRTTGNTHITSDLDSKQEVRVRIWEVRWVRQ